MGSGSSSDTSNKEIVIIGGGYGGSLLAHKLVKGNVGKVTLVEPRDGLVHNIGALRVVVDKKYSDKFIIPYAAKLESCHIKSKATALDSKNKTVTLENGQTIKYTELVIATGTSAPFPGKLGLDNPSMTKEEILQKYAEIRKEVEASSKIVIIGGGAVGVELAGEIKSDFKDKEVTIINSRDYLVSNKGKPAFQTTLQSKLNKLKVELLLNERVTNMQELTLNKHQENQIVKTSSDKEIACDLVVPCTGTKINNSFFKEELADAVNEVGALCVDEYLRVKGHDDIYAIGDVNDVAEEKMAYTAKLQGNAVLTSLKGKLKKYNAAEFGMAVPLGRNGGVSTFKGMMMGDFMTKKLKSEELFASMMWGDLDQKAPK